MKNRLRQDYLQRCRARASFMLVAFGTLAAVPLCHAQQNQPALQITSPSNDTVVTPGQTLSISIVSPTNTSFTNVMVVAGAPMRASDVANSVPAQVSFAIPSDIELGKYTITATGTSSTGKVMYAGPIDLDVERQDLPTRLASDRRKIVFTSRGQRSGLRFHATFADGAYLDATLSSNLTLTSSDTSVATVDKNADVTAVGKGSATITATYTVGTQSITASVPVTVPPAVTTSIHRGRQAR